MTDSYDSRNTPTTDRQGKTVLVDTSLLIELQKRRKYAEPVRQQVTAFRFRGISSYSKLEFKRAWLQRLAYIHSLTRNEDVHSVLDVQDRITRRLADSRQCRAVKTCLDAIAAFLELADTTISVRAQLARLKAHCKQAVLRGAQTIREFSTREGEFRGTGCVRAEEWPVERLNGSLDVTIHDCRRNEIRCLVHEFFGQNQEKFIKIGIAVRESPSASDELQRMGKEIALAQEDPVRLCNNRVCCKLADAIIAIDGIDMDVFAANNDRDWSLIASVLGKPLINPVAEQKSLPPKHLTNCGPIPE